MQKVNLSELKKSGPYSHAIISGNLVFLSGQIGLNGHNENDFESQFDNAVANIELILKEAGSSISGICKVTVFLADERLFDIMNKKFAEKFAEVEPARTTVISKLPRKDMLVELDVIATLTI